jgi:hypothetical protein
LRINPQRDFVGQRLSSRSVHLVKE